MPGLFFGILLIGLFALFFSVLAGPHLERRRRNRVTARPFPETWDAALRRDMRHYPRLPDALRREVQTCLQVLMAEKRFEACGGLEEVTLTMRLLVLAQAALLLAGRSHHGYFPGLQSILIYPSTYRDSGQRRFALHNEEEPDTRLGESWHSGSVVLAWDSVRRGAAGQHGGLNVTLHEFAHQLDQEDGLSDGAPLLDEIEDYAEWSGTFQQRYEELVADVADGRHSVLDEYGATNPAEFFAVATETFFERPHQLHREMPDLYAELKAFYGLDPLTWVPAR